MLPHKIACEPLYDPDTTDSGLLYIPETAKERCDQGIVKYIGADVTLVKPGDHVLFSGYTGTFVQIQYEGKLIILPEEFVTCIIIDDPFEVSGLYFRSKDGAYFNATYEQTTTLIARSLERVNTVTPARKSSRLDGRPTVDDYEKLK